MSDSFECVVVRAVLILAVRLESGEPDIGHFHASWHI